MYFQADDRAQVCNIHVGNELVWGMYVMEYRYMEEWYEMGIRG